MAMTSLTVVGSVNRDMLLRVPELPTPGETMRAGQTEELLGGKGANQAVAAARLGSTVRLIAKVGSGDEPIVSRLRAEGIDVAGVTTTSTSLTGLATVIVDASGENMIVVSPGANAELGVRDLPERLGSAGDVLLVQNEISQEVTDAAILRAAAQGMTVLANPAPARAFDDAVLSAVDVLVPNLGELAVLLGESAPASVDGVRRLLEASRVPVGALVVTLGSEGAIVLVDGVATHIPAVAVDAVDTVGAGDTFCGALADGLARGLPLVAAAERAVAAASASVTGIGAQSAMPYAAQLPPIDHYTASATLA